ncbi:MAG: ZIP family metal transporter [Muribaculaceae bacterium]
MNNLLISAAGLCLATIIGSILGFGIRNLPHRWNDTILGYCAGIMLAAAVFGLITPAVDLCHTTDWWVVIVGVLLGAAFLNVLDYVTPHLHHITGIDPEKHHQNSSINRIMLFVMAIAIHKLPEGMAAGVGFNNTADLGSAWTVTMGIALQNIPEGMVVISPLMLAGVKPMRTMAISIAIGLLEVVGVMIGYGLGSISATLLPVLLAFAGGAMLYVVSDEMIPETHAHGYQKSATYALLMGFLTLLFIERLFE